MDKDSTHCINNRILLVDACPLHLGPLTEFLETHGYQVETVTNGELTVSTALKHIPNLILLDHSISGMEADAICLALKSISITKNIPIIFFGESDDELIQVKAFEMGACDYVPKPIAVFEMLARIQYHLQMSLKVGAPPLWNKEVDSPPLLESAVIYAKDAIVLSRVKANGSPNSRIVFVNQAFTDMTGYPAQESIGRSLTILHGPKTSPVALHSIQESINTCTPLQIEILNYAKDGTELWLDMTLTPLLDSQGVVTHWLNIARDISDRKQFEQKTVSSLLRERELNKFTSHFASMLCHEYHNPLATILSSVDLLEFYEHCSSEEEKKTLFSQIRTAIEQMTNLSQKIMTFDDSVRGLFTFQPSSLDLTEFCQELVQAYQPNIRSNHQIELTFRGERFEGIVDKTLLHHILSNLISNAVKYSPDGGIIKFEVCCQYPTASFRIHDQGIGIPAEAIPNLFQVFYRADNVANISGTGLGLSIVKQFVESHKGSITCESQVGEGSIFTVTIPLNLKLDSVSSFEREFIPIPG